MSTRNIYLDRGEIEEIARDSVGTTMASRLYRTYGIPPATVVELVRECLYASLGNPHRAELAELRESDKQVFPIKKAGVLKRVSTALSRRTAPPEQRWAIDTAVFEARMDFLQYLVANDLLLVGPIDVQHQLLVTGRTVNVEAGPVARHLDVDPSRHELIMETFPYRPWVSASR